MNKDLLEFFNIQNKIFGVCPVSGQLFRLSDCKIFLKKRPEADWMDKLDREAARLDEAQVRLDERESVMREKGRKQALKRVKKIDKVFTPRRLNPDDAHVIFHPVDYVVFNGLTHNAPDMKNILLLDRTTKDPQARKTQASIEKAVSKGRYEWLTLRVDESGEVAEER
ncbi:MAG: Holliday junction resolvase-like protein [bacterium]